MKILFFFFGITFFATTIHPSCGGPPNYKIFETEGDSIIHFGNEYNSYRETSKKSVLFDSVNALFRHFEHISIVEMDGETWFDWEHALGTAYQYYIRTVRVLKGNEYWWDQESGTIPRGYDGPHTFQVIGTQFLQFSNEFPPKSVTAAGPCYSFPHGYFIEKDSVFNFNLAFGFKIPIDTIVKANLSSNPTDWLEVTDNINIEEHNSVSITNKSQNEISVDSLILSSFFPPMVNAPKSASLIIQYENTEKEIFRNKPISFDESVRPGESIEIALKSAKINDRQTDSSSPGHLKANVPLFLWLLTSKGRKLVKITVPTYEKGSHLSDITTIEAKSPNPFDFGFDLIGRKSLAF